jgi:hypothetical protein
VGVHWAAFYRAWKREVEGLGNACDMNIEGGGAVC